MNIRYLGEATVFLKQIQAFADQIQALEDALWTIYDNRNVNYVPDPSTVANPSVRPRPVLDDLGENVGQSRLGMTNAAYSLAIKAKIQANKSCGEPERLIAFLKSLTGSDELHYKEYYPCLIYLCFAGLSYPENTINYLRQIAPGAVRVDVVRKDSTRAFKFSSGSSSVIDENHGFSNLSQSTGGKLSELLQ